MFGIWYPHVNVVSEKGTKQSQIFGCFCELLKIVLFFEFCLKNICVCIYIYCRVTNRGPNPGEKGYGPNKPSTINL